MWVDIQVGPWVMVFAWGLLFLALSTTVYGFARAAESIARDRGEPKQSGGTWGITDTLGTALCAVVILAATFIPGTVLLYWLGEALGK